MKKIILLFLTLAIYGFQCGEECELQAINKYDLKLNGLMISEYVLGDTIHLAQDFDAMLQLESEELYDNTNLSLGFKLVLLKIRDDFGPIDSGFTFFETIIENGSLKELVSFKDDISRNLIFECNDLLCSFDLKLIPKQKGIYCIGSLDMGTFGMFDICEDNRLEPIFSEGVNNYDELVESPHDNFWIESGVTRVSITNIESRPDFYFFEVN